MRITLDFYLTMPSNLIVLHNKSPALDAVFAKPEGLGSAAPHATTEAI